MTGEQNKRTPYLFIILRALDDSGMYAALRTNFTCELNEQFYFELPNTQWLLNWVELVNVHYQPDPLTNQFTAFHLRARRLNCGNLCIDALLQSND